MRLVNSVILFLTLATLSAQQRIQATLEWADEPRVVVWESERVPTFGYRLLREGAAAGAMNWDKEPGFMVTFPADGPGSYEVDVLSTTFEPVRAAGKLVGLPESFAFAVSVTRGPEGYVGKVAAPALVNTPTGPQRLTGVDLRLRPVAGAKRLDFPFAGNSVLGQGEWYRIDVTTEGIHRVTRDFITGTLGANLDGVDPRTIALYGQVTSGQLPEVTNFDPPDDLTEIPIQIDGEGDGSFDGGDALYFYGKGPDGRRYDRSQGRFVYDKNIYTTTNSYFLRIGGATGARVGALPTAAGGETTDTYDAYYHFEEDEHNLLHELPGNAHGSGQDWYGEFFKVVRDRTYTNVFQIPGLVAGQTATFDAVMGLRSEVSSRFFVEIDGKRLQSATASRVRFGSQEQSPAIREARLTSGIVLDNENVSVKIDYPLPAGAEDSEAYLDYFELRARRRLQFGPLGQFTFLDADSRDQPAVTYRFVDFPTDGRVWRIEGADVRSATVNGGQFSAVAGGVAFEYVAFRTGAALLAPSGGARIDNQNLHGLTSAELLIVAHPDFLTQARQLADHRRDFSGLNVRLATTQQVYNEFSSGRPDAAAIRNFGRMLSQRDPGFRYILLFGDGSFDHRDILDLGTNFIPTYQHTGAPTEVGSYPADDFYGIYTDATAAQPLEPDLTVAIGRLPIKTGDEASEVVRKLIRYDTDPSIFDDWRTRMTFVGDDEDGGQHTRDVDRVAEAAGELKPDLNFDKLYFDLFPQQSLSAGDRFPDITEGLDRAIFRGALAVTYLGHGGPRGWAQERVLTIPQIRNWNRPSGAEDPIQPPIFVTATCTFSNYDDASFVSAGEEALLTPNGGVSALLTTTRPVFATQNYRLTNATVEAMMGRDDGRWRTVGDVIRIAKNTITQPSSGSRLTSSTDNARKFTLLGDPAMRIALPEHAVRTTLVDDQPITEERQDTVRALQKMKISGEVTDLAGNLLSSFNGQVFPTIYDKPITVTTLGQDPGSPALDVEVQRNIVFRGRATVTGGKFDFEFVVPRDINYTFGAGKVSYYAADPDNLTDAAGFYDGLIIGGTAEGVDVNDEGPTVDVFMDNEDFMSGGQVDEDPVLLVKLTDDLGINVTGNSIGHDLEAILDEDTRNAIVLNDYYEAEADDFRSGSVRYPLFDLEPGLHSITVRAWDVANNNSQGSTEFIVAEDGADAIRRVLNYPNPFIDRTCFQFDHTLVGQDVEAIVQIYTVNGRLVKTLQKTFSFSDGSIRRDDCMEWDGLDDFGDTLGRGVYLYQVRLRGDDTNVVDGDLEKLVILK